MVDRYTCLYIAQSMFVWQGLYFRFVVFAYLHNWTSLALLNYHHSYTIRTYHALYSLNLTLYSYTSYLYQLNDPYFQGEMWREDLANGLNLWESFAHTEECVSVDSWTQWHRIYQTQKNSGLESKNWLFVCKLQQRHYGGLVINSELSLQQTKIIST